MVGLGCGIFKRCENVVFFERRIVLKNFLMGGSRAEPRLISLLENIPCRPKRLHD